MDTNSKTFNNQTTTYVEQKPYVDDNGIYAPCCPYLPEGATGAYKCIMTKEMFVEAYNKWIKEE